MNELITRESATEILLETIERLPGNGEQIHPDLLHGLNKLYQFLNG